MFGTRSVEEAIFTILYNFCEVSRTFLLWNKLAPNLVKIAKMRMTAQKTQ